MEGDKVFNYCESALWFIIAIILLLRSQGRQSEVQKIGLIAGVTFVVFAISDLIEAQSGAWWRPTWLLFLKTGCVAVFIECFRRYRRALKRVRNG